MSRLPREALEDAEAELRELLPCCTVRERLRLADRLDRLLPAREPAKVADKLAALVRAARESAAAVAAAREALPQPDFPEDLPISARRDEIVSLIRGHSVVIVAGETGSGKTTQLPKMCLEAGLGAAGRIGCTQPRRVAALSVSRRIAEELKVPYGREVGCKIRFTDKTSEQTAVKMMTDGILLNELQADRLLGEYEALIVDEAHERSLNIDFLLGYLKTLVERRADLRVIVTSATIDTQAFSEAFGGAPVVEASGRTFPVSVEYRPLEEAAGEDTQLDVVAATAEDIVTANEPGDILVFLPGEREIREVAGLLEHRDLGRAEVLPLFGRLSAAEQHRIFAPTQRRKVILATNIAETSITLPGIRFVIDTGTARISRFSAHTRTQRLPVEPVSQSSADQRKGRAGRVAEGRCIRLYSEKDYLSRPKYTQPEILRSNLASVILRMKAFELGEVETFPFINPPEPRAITGGYRLLEDLGAIDAGRNLTALGRELARLPVDPTVGRMLLQARREHCLREVLVIAAGLSIQDPRERPMEKEAAADQMHRRFRHRDSDFLTLLNIWDAYHGEMEKLSQRQLRRFCADHFLSYLRMREWRDIHDQLTRVMRELDDFRLGEKPADYASIHRSLLVGLPGNIAHKDRGNHYRGTHGRKVMLFPGSVLFDRRAEKAGKKKKNEASDTSRQGHTPDWVLCAEWVETSRLFARTLARLDVRWVMELCGHLCTAHVGDPFWDASAGRVLARERRYLHGLEVAMKKVDYARHNPEEATDLFVRSALVEDDVREQLGFLEHNRAVRARVEDYQTRLRQSSLHALDDRLYRFYSARLENVGGVADLRRFMRERHGGDDAFLRVSEQQLLGQAPTGDALDAFPDAVTIDGEKAALHYAYKPGEDEDGVTLEVGTEQFGALQPGVIDWLVPGYIEQRVQALLRNLPKVRRKHLIPLADTAREVCARLEPSPRPLAEQVREVVRNHYGVQTAAEDWAERGLPAHLKPRIQIRDTEKGEVLASGRDWERLRQQYRTKVRLDAQGGRGVSELQLWKRARARWERTGLTGWSFDDPPESIEVGLIGEVPVRAWPGLRCDSDPGTVSLVLFGTVEEARRASLPGWLRLGERELGREFAWLQRDLKDLRKIGPALALLGPFETVREQMYLNIRQSLLAPDALLPLRRTVFDGRVAGAREALRGLVPRLVDQLGRILQLRQELVTGEQPVRGLGTAAERLVPPEFCARVGLERFAAIERYLKALRIRGERARANPARDAEKAARIAPFVKAYNELVRDHKKASRRRAEIDELRWLIEELKVSLFAQELGTDVPVSEKKLQEAVRRLRAG